MDKMRFHSSTAKQIEEHAAIVRSEEEERTRVFEKFTIFWSKIGYFSLFLHFFEKKFAKGHFFNVPLHSRSTTRSQKNEAAYKLWPH